MPRRPDLDSVAQHITSYIARDEWLEHRRAHLDALLGPIPSHFGLDPAGVLEEVHELGHASSLVGFVDESFLASRHGPERLNPVDDYLRRRGWQETPRAREYLQGIRDTPPSLYEVQDVGWGEWVDLRDRLRDGPPVRVVEHSASQTLQRWDCLVARIVHPRDELMLTGGVLSAPRPVADEIESMFRKVEKRAKRGLAEVARELGVEPSALGNAEGQPIAFADRLCLHVWLKGLLQVSRRPLPQLSNTDGDTLLPTRTRLPILGGADAVARAIDALPEWQRDESDGLEWMWSSAVDDGPGTILGNARIDGDALVVETNSRERMHRALALLGSALGGLVGTGLTVHEDMQADLEAAVRRGRPRKKKPEPDWSPEDAPAIAAALGQVLDAHYRRTLDEPVPVLGNRTPRDCAKSKAGRKKLVRWLKDIENGELQRAAAQQMTPNDLAWMWVELGVEGER